MIIGADSLEESTKVHLNCRQIVLIIYHAHFIASLDFCHFKAW